MTEMYNDMADREKTSVAGNDCPTPDGSGNLIARTQETIEQAEFFVKYRKARWNFGHAIVLTLINMVLMLFGSSCSFPFSAFLPSALVGVAKVSDSGAMTCVCAGLAIAIVLLLAACWFFCWVRPWWMVLALLVFLVDTGLTIVLCSQVGGFSLVATAFHVWVLYYLFSGVGAGFRLRASLRK